MQQPLSSAELPKRKKEKKGNKEALPHDMLRSTRLGHKLPLFQIITAQLFRERRSENFKVTFVIFFCTHLKVNVVLCNRTMIQSQETTSTITPMLYERGSFQFSLVCKIPDKNLCRGECATTVRIILIFFIIKHKDTCIRHFSQTLPSLMKWSVPVTKMQNNHILLYFLICL